jgi:hypothetical protein
MSRNQAKQILKKAQTILADQICARIIECEEDFLNSFTDFDLGYFNDVFDKADKLRDLSIILGSLPDDEPDPEGTYPGVMETQPNVIVAAAPSQLPVDLNAFVQLVTEGRINDASVGLRHLFGLSQERSVECAKHFSNLWVADVDTWAKACKIKQTLEHPNQAILLLSDLFGLNAMEAARAVQAARKTMLP